MTTSGYESRTRWFLVTCEGRCLFWCSGFDISCGVFALQVWTEWLNHRQATINAGRAMATVASTGRPHHPHPTGSAMDQLDHLTTSFKSSSSQPSLAAVLPGMVTLTILIPFAFSQLTDLVSLWSRNVQGEVKSVKITFGPSKRNRPSRQIIDFCHEKAKWGYLCLRPGLCLSLSWGWQRSGPIRSCNCWLTVNSTFILRASAAKASSFGGRH